MKTKIIALCIALFSMAGCASFFNIGHENFACKGNEAGGKCGDPLTIYKNRDKLLNDAVTDISRKETDSGKPDPDEKDIGPGESAESPAGEGSQPPVPVRKAEDVRRIYVKRFRDSRGDYIGGFWMFTVVKDGEWVSPDGKTLR